MNMRGVVLRPAVAFVVVMVVVVVLVVVVVVVRAVPEEGPGWEPVEEEPGGL